MRRQILLGSLLVFAAGIPLFIGTEQTDRYFSWTINPPFLTAAFLGATYWAGLFLGALAARERTWARARIAVPGPLLFTVLMLVATLLHLDRFHLNSPDLLTRTITWLWIAIYVAVPVMILALLVPQLRLPGGDLPRQEPLPLSMRLVFGIHAVVLLAVGLALFVAPQATALLWPWKLTPLTARAVASWLVALGVVAAQSLWEHDLGRAQPVMVTSTVFGLLQFVALARYPGDMEWSEPSALVYLAFLLSMLTVGLYGWRAARLAGRRVALVQEV